VLGTEHFKELGPANTIKQILHNKTFFHQTSKVHPFSKNEPIFRKKFFTSSMLLIVETLTRSLLLGAIVHIKVQPLNNKGINFEELSSQMILKTKKFF